MTHKGDRAAAQWACPANTALTEWVKPACPEMEQTEAGVTCETGRRENAASSCCNPNRRKSPSAGTPCPCPRVKATNTQERLRNRPRPEGAGEGAWASGGPFCCEGHILRPEWVVGCDHLSCVGRMFVTGDTQGLGHQPSPQLTPMWAKKKSCALRFQLKSEKFPTFKNQNLTKEKTKLPCSHWHQPPVPAPNCPRGHKPWPGSHGAPTHPRNSADTSLKGALPVHGIAPHPTWPLLTWVLSPGPPGPSPLADLRRARRDKAIEERRDPEVQRLSGGNRQPPWMLASLTHRPSGQSTPPAR